MERERIEGVLGLLDPGKCAGAMVEAIDELDAFELEEQPGVSGSDPLVDFSKSTLVAVPDAACEPSTPSCCASASVFKPFESFDLSFMSDMLDPPIISPVKKSDRRFLSVASYDPETYFDQLAFRALETPATKSLQRKRKLDFATPTKRKTVRASSPKTAKPSPKAKTVKAPPKTAKPSPKTEPSPKTAKPSPKTVKAKPSPKTVKAVPKTAKPSPKTATAAPQTVKREPGGGGGAGGGGGGGGGANGVGVIMTPKCVKSRAYYKAKIAAERAGKSADEARRLGRVAYHAA